MRPRAFVVGDELLHRFGLRHKQWELKGSYDVTLGRNGDVFEVSEGYLLRIGREGISRAADFGPVDDRVRFDIGAEDVVLSGMADSETTVGQTTVWRVPSSRRLSTSFPRV